MMGIAYNLVLFLTRLAYAIAMWFNPKARLFVTGRRNWKESLSSWRNTRPDERVVWFHCASLGEFEQARPLMEAVAARQPAPQILLTFFSPSGYEARKRYAGASFVTYLPWDTAANAGTFLDVVRPSLVVFVKYEFWHHFSSEIARRKIPLLSISSIFRPEQIFFKPMGGFFRAILKNFSYFFVQDDASVELLHSIGIDRCIRAGDTRFDRVFAIAKQGKEIPVARVFKGDDKVMVIGSCWDKDLEVLFPFINNHPYQLKFIIAPHEISESMLSHIEKNIAGQTIRMSAANADMGDRHALLVDSIGLLPHLYRYAEYAYVGGAFGKGLHNILEAACQGIPIFFGNRNYTKFKEARDLVLRGGAFPVGSSEALRIKYETVSAPENFLPACEATREYVQENLGATDRIMNYCSKYLA